MIGLKRDEVQSGNQTINNRLWGKPCLLVGFHHTSEPLYFGEDMTDWRKLARPYRKTGKIINCIKCNHPFYCIKNALTIRKYCSHKCYWQDRKDKQMLPPSRKGSKLSSEHKKRISEVNKKRIGDKNSSWKGDKVGYGGLHTWLLKNFKKPNHCEICCIKGKRLEWALRKYKKYERKRENFIAICRVCHFAYDGIGKKMWKTRRKKNV